MDRAQRSPLTPNQGGKASPRILMRAGPGTTERTSSSSESPSKRHSSSSTPGKSRASPLMTDASLFLEYTKRTAMEAQAQRTNVRLLELEKEANDEVMAEDFQGVQPDDLPLPAYPGTAARKNVTVRRSRDRLSAVSSTQPRSPEDLTLRLPKRRERDVRYSIESDTASRGATAFTYRRQHGREIQESHLHDRGTPTETTPDSAVRYKRRHGKGFREAYLRDRGTPADITPVFDPNSSPGRDDQGSPQDLGKDRFHSREFNSPRDFTKRDQDREITRLRELPDEVVVVQSDDEEGSEGEVLSLFLKRDIPDVHEDHATHETLTQLWELRQKASTHLVEALSKDDSDLFDSLEEQMRKLNQNMHRVYKQYLDQKATKSDAELVVSSVEQNQNSTVIYEDKDSDLQIKLDYNGIQVLRRINVTTTNRVVYHLAQQYLREVFALRVANLSDLLLLHRHHEIPIDGNVGDKPILDGDEIMVMFRRWGNSERTQRQPDLRFDDEESDEDSSKSEGDEDDYWRECWPSQTGMRRGNPKRDFHKDGTRRNNKKNLDEVTSVGDHADHHREERHDLNHARAPSQPGTNGGAFASGRNTDRYSRREHHELNHARAPSQPGTNGGASNLGRHKESYHGEDYRLLYDVRTPDPVEPATSSQGMTLQAMPMRDDGVGSRSFDKIRQSFKCPKFSGQCKDWKPWNKGFMRYLSIWELEYVLDPDFLDVLQMTPSKKRDNKMVYFIIEDAVDIKPDITG
jgi:hypothetical protein